MILITSAGGRTGRHLIPALKARGMAVRAFVRREQPGLPALGATEQFVGDMLDRNALARACDGVTMVIHTGPMGADEPVMGRWIVDAAQAAGVSRFVYISVTHPQTEWLLNHQNKLRVEDHLISSGLAFTILQPMHYFQNIDVGPTIARGIYASPYSPSVGLSFVDLLDLAEAAAKVVAEPGHEFATYEICGSDHLTTDEVVAVLSARAGIPIRNETLSVEEFVARIPGTGHGYFGDFLIRLMTYYRRYGIRGNPNVLTWLLGRPPITFEDYVDRMLAG
ncbi:MAG: SDR family oxidoreductase [Allosphingosinicella sp.]